VDVWTTIGFTYDAKAQTYYLIKDAKENRLCLACTHGLAPEINAFCYYCKAPRSLDWTTGSNSLDSFIMSSWYKTNFDTYLQWIEYTQLTNIVIEEKATSHHGCTHKADWLDQQQMN
jgi:hypothetical protein